MPAEALLRSGSGCSHIESELFLSPREFQSSYVAKVDWYTLSIELKRPTGPKTQFRCPSDEAKFRAPQAGLAVKYIGHVELSCEALN
jgi:hypothetical protein